jgi:hypothetical protein
MAEIESSSTLASLTSECECGRACTEREISRSSRFRLPVRSRQVNPHGAHLELTWEDSYQRRARTSPYWKATFSSHHIASRSLANATLISLLACPDEDNNLAWRGGNDHGIGCIRAQPSERTRNLGREKQLGGCFFYVEELLERKLCTFALHMLSAPGMHPPNIPLLQAVVSYVLG